MTNRHPEMPFFPKTATQKGKKHPCFSPRWFFHLIGGFQKHPKVLTYLIKEHFYSQKKASQHFEKLVTLIKAPRAWRLWLLEKGVVHSLCRVCWLWRRTWASRACPSARARSSPCQSWPRTASSSSRAAAARSGGPGRGPERGWGGVELVIKLVVTALVPIV